MNSQASCYRILTAVGADRPGLVNRIASSIHEHGANIEDSRMAMLGGEFALMVLLCGEEAAVDRVQQAVAGLAKELELEVFFKTTSAHHAGGDARPYRIQVSGLDHPGIVHNVSDVWASFGANVVSLETQLVHAPMTGTPTFVMRGQLLVPSDASMAKLRHELAERCEAEHLDFVLEPLI
jgi:glycine cleavage system transcriptional repressor